MEKTTDRYSDYHEDSPQTVGSIGSIVMGALTSITYDATSEWNSLRRPFETRHGFSRIRYALAFPFLALLSLLKILLFGTLNLLDILFGIVQRVVGMNGMPYFFLLPNMLVFGIFVLLPMFLNFYMGFTGGSAIRIEDRPWVGTENLAQLLDCENFTDPNSCREDLFWRGVGNTLFYVFAQVSTMVVLALVTALALNGKIVLRGFFRSVFFYPVLLSPVVVAIIWLWILEGDNSLLNIFIGALGFEPVDFLTDRNWARFWVIVVSDWAQMGFYTLILLAGLQSIPGSLYEAAEMDGANPLDSFRYVTFPLLMPTMTVVLVLSLIRAVQVFDQVFVLTGGGPGTATQYIVQYIYRTAFGDGARNYGLAAAASIMLASVLLLLTFGQLALARRRDQV